VLCEIRAAEVTALAPACARLVAASSRMSRDFQRAGRAEHGGRIPGVERAAPLEPRDRLGACAVRAESTLPAASSVMPMRQWENHDFGARDAASRATDRATNRFA